MRGNEEPNAGVDFDALQMRLIELGVAEEALPAVHEAIDALQASSGDPDGVEMEDLVQELRRRDRAHVASWLEEAVEYLRVHGRPATMGGAAARARAAADGPPFWTHVPHAQISRDASAATGFEVRTRGYESLEDLWYQVAHAFEGAPEVRRAHYSRLAEMVQAGERVLDVGSGDGLLLELIRERGAAGVGVEVDPAKVAESRAKGLEVREGRLQDIEWDSTDRYDVVTLVQIIEHLEPADALRLLDGACRLLTPQGRLLIVTPNAANPFVAQVNFWLDITHVRLYPEPLLHALATRLGFPFVRTSTMGPSEYGDMDVFCCASRTVISDPVDRR